MSFTIHNPNNDLSKLMVWVDSSTFSGDVLELNTTGFNHFDEIARCIKGSIKPTVYTTECIFGCAHTYSGYALSIISNRADTSLSVKSLSPQYQIWSPACCCKSFSLNVGRVEVTLPHPQGSIQVFIQI